MIGVTSNRTYSV